MLTLSWEFLVWASVRSSKTSWARRNLSDSASLRFGWWVLTGSLLGLLLRQSLRNFYLLLGITWGSILSHHYSIDFWEKQTQQAAVFISMFYFEEIQSNKFSFLECTSEGTCKAQLGWSLIELKWEKSKDKMAKEHLYCLGYLFASVQ